MRLAQHGHAGVGLGLIFGMQREVRWEEGVSCIFEGHGGMGGFMLLAF